MFINIHKLLKIIVQMINDGDNRFSLMDKEKIKCKFYSICQTSAFF